MSQELTRKEMKGPDKFLATFGHAATWMTSHRGAVLTLLAAVGILAVAAIVVSLVQGRRAQEAGAALSALTAVLEGEISPVPLPGSPGPFYPTAQARQRAVLEAAENVAEAYPGTPAGRTATLAAADARFRLGEWDAAVAGYQRYLEGAGAGDSLAFGAIEGMALAEEARGNQDAAAAAWERLARDVPAQSDRADLERARLLVRVGRTEEARAVLSAFPEAHPESALVAEAAERLARLGAR
jgi:tetratricopeptide (TPR) repeat protein